MHVHVACTHHIHTSLKRSLVYRAEKLFAVLTAFARAECLRGLGLRLRPRLLPQRCQMPTEPLARKTDPSRMDLPCTRSSPSSRRTHQRRSPCTSLQPSEPLARKTDPSRMDLPCTRSSPSSRRTHQRRSPCTSLQPSEPLARKTDPPRMDLPCITSSPSRGIVRTASVAALVASTTTSCAARRRSWRPPPLALFAA